MIDALEEAHRKVRGIEDAAQGLHSRELKTRLDRICQQARAILAQLEQDPKNLSRARRFLVTYLDGTRDVVTNMRPSSAISPKPRWRRTSAAS